MKKFFSLVCACFLLAGTLFADVSPWDAWRLGYTCFEKGEGCRDRGEYTNALKAFQEALEHYNNVRRARPDWNQKVITRRIADCERECERMKRLLGSNTPTTDQMAESGASVLRPASGEVARELDDIRKQLSEAKAELASLRQKTAAQRNYEQEITLLLRDQRVARERYILLERRYRDLEQASRQPDQLTEELKEQLLGEKMKSEQLKKQVETLARRRTLDESRFQASETRRRSVERQLGERNAEILRLNRESTALRQFQKDAVGEQTNLKEQLERVKAELLRLEQLRNAGNEEIAALKKKLASSDENETSPAVRERTRKLLELANQANAQKAELQKKLDQSLIEVEKLKVQILQAKVTEAVRKDLEKNVQSKNKNIEKLGRELGHEKRTVAVLRQSVAELISEQEKTKAQAELEKKHHSAEILRLNRILDDLKKDKKVVVPLRISELEKKIGELQAQVKQAELKRSELEIELKHKTDELESRQKFAAGQQAIAGGDSSKELQELRSKLADSLKSLETARADLEKALQNQKLQHDRHAAALAERTAEIQKLQNALNAGMAKAGEKRSVQSLVDENRKLAAEIEQLKVRIRSKEGEIARLQIDAENIRKQNDRLVAGVQKSKTDLEVRSGEVSSLKAEIEKERSASSAVAAELQRLREQKNEMEQDLKTAVDRAALLEKRLSNRDSEDFRRLTASQDERKKLSDQAAALQHELVRLRAESDTLKKSGADLKQELDRISAEHTRVVAERNRLLEDSKKQLAAIGKLAGAEKDLAAMKKNFAALQAENKENKLLAEAAKPREAELAQIKLRLAELDQLKAQLAREQRLNEELKNANRRLESERGSLILLRSQISNAKKRIGELEPLVKEVAALKKLNSELAVAKNLEAELTEARSKLNSFEALRLELNHSKKRIRVLESEKIELERQSARARNLASGTQLLNSELESARKTADELAKDKALRELELARLRTRLNVIPQLEAEILRLKESKSAIDPAVSVEIKQLKRKANEMQLLADKLALQKKEADFLSEQLARIRKENSSLRLRAAESGQLAEVVKSLSAVNEKLKQGLTPDSQKVVDLMKKVAVLEADSAALKRLQKKEKMLILQAASAGEEVQKLRSKSRQYDLLLAENQQLKTQNAELEKQESIQKELLRVRQEAEQLKAQAARVSKLEQLLSRAENAGAGKQAELDRSRRELAAAEQVKKNLLLQQRENSSMRVSLAKVRSELEQMKLQVIQVDALRSELERQKKLTAELVDAKTLEAELAQAKLRLVEFDQIKAELARVTKYNNELTEQRQRLEKELASRPSSAEERLRSQLDMVSTLPTGKPEDFTASGKIAESDGSFELAVWNYEQALKINRNYIPAADRLGRIMLDRRDYRRAAELLSLARSKDPVNTELACLTAGAYIGLKRYGNALAILSPLADRSSDHYMVQMLLGKALAGSGDNRAAEARLKIAVRLAPAGVFEPRLELAKFLVTTDVRRLEEAARIYEAARVAGAAPDIELEPRLGSRLDERREVSSFLRDAAREAERSGDWKSAGWYYKQLVEMGREKDKYVPRLAFALYRNGDAPAAMEILTFNRSTALSSLVAALIQLSNKEYPAMLASARKAVALNKGRAVLLPVDWSEFAVEFEKLRKTHPDSMTGAVGRAFRIQR